MDSGMGNAGIDVGVFGAGDDGRVDGLLATRVSRLYNDLFLCHCGICFTVFVLLRGAFCGNFTGAIGVAESYAEINFGRKGSADMSNVETTCSGLLAWCIGGVCVVYCVFPARIR
jgi:hypothetical protein